MLILFFLLILFFFLHKQVTFLRTPSILWYSTGLSAILLLNANSYAVDDAAVDSTPSSYLVRYTAVAPTIDGVLDEPLWSQVIPTNSFVIHHSGKTAPVTTVAQLAWDKQYLYLAATCEDKDIYAHHTDNQSPLFRRDDLVEIFVDPDGDGKRYVEIGFSANSVHYSLIVPEVIDGKIEPESLEIPELRYATQIHGSLNNPADSDLYWTLEVRIPLTALNPAPLAETSQWRLGLFRIDYSSHSKTNQAEGYYAWQYLGQFGFHRPERFGYVNFGRTTNVPD